MDKINALLEQFHEDSIDRCEIVVQLADVCDERIISLLISTLQNFNEDDLVRIEILKSLVLRSDTEPVRIRIANVIQQILETDEDDIVRQYAAKALRDYISIEGTLDTLESIVADESEDIDVRHNALTAIEANRSQEDCRAALQRLTQVPELGRSAQRALDSM